jgi:hypothetical protein
MAFTAVLDTNVLFSATLTGRPHDGAKPSVIQITLH